MTTGSASGEGPLDSGDACDLPISLRIMLVNRGRPVCPPLQANLPQLGQLPRHDPEIHVVATESIPDSAVPLPLFVPAMN